MPEQDLFRVDVRLHAGIAQSAHEDGVKIAAQHLERAGPE